LKSRIRKFLFFILQAVELGHFSMVFFVVHATASFQLQ